MWPWISQWPYPLNVVFLISQSCCNYSVYSKCEGSYQLFFTVIMRRPQPDLQFFYIIWLVCEVMRTVLINWREVSCVPVQVSLARPFFCAQKETEKKNKRRSLTLKLMHGVYTSAEPLAYTEFVLSSWDRIWVTSQVPEVRWRRLASSLKVWPEDTKTLQQRSKLGGFLLAALQWIQSAVLLWNRDRNIISQDHGVTESFCLFYVIGDHGNVVESAVDAVL